MGQCCTVSCPAMIEPSKVIHVQPPQLPALEGDEENHAYQEKRILSLYRKHLQNYINCNFLEMEEQFHYEELRLNSGGELGEDEADPGTQEADVERPRPRKPLGTSPSPTGSKLFTFMGDVMALRQLFRSHCYSAFGCALALQQDVVIWTTADYGTIKNRSRLQGLGTVQRSITRVDPDKRSINKTYYFIDVDTEHGTVHLGLSPTFQQRNLIMPMADKEKMWLKQRGLVVETLNLYEGEASLCLILKYKLALENRETLASFLQLATLNHLIVAQEPEKHVPEDDEAANSDEQTDRIAVLKAEMAERLRKAKEAQDEIDRKKKNVEHPFLPDVVENV